MLIVALPMLAIAWSFAGLNRCDPNCRSAYGWAGRIVGPDVDRDVHFGTKRVRPGSQLINALQERASAP